MTDEAVDPAASEGQEPEAPDSKQYDADYVKRLRAENAKYRNEAKANADAAGRLAQLEESQKTEAQRHADAAEAARKDAEAARAEALRYRIATKFGLTDEDAETFLNGTDEDTLTRQAERLAALNAQSAKTPKPDRSQGAKGGETALSDSPGAAFEQFLSGQLSR